MDFKIIADKLASQENSESAQIIRTIGDQSAEQIRDGKLKIVELVQGLDPILTDGNHDVRLKGVELLVRVVTSLPKNLLNEKEIEVLSEFLCLRLIDHKSMELTTLKCLSYFIDCDNKPARYNKQLLEFITTKTTVQKMDIETRHQVYEIAKKVVVERHQVSNTIDSELIYSLVHIIEGENNPENLMLCFGIVSFILKNFIDLEPYIDDLFEWLTAYYPIDYTPSEAHENIKIQRSDLVQVLYDCFYANPLNSENLQTLLLEKLDSNMMSTKLESLNCLIRCYEEFPLSSIKNYTSTLWTAIRMTCLKKTELVDSILLEMSYKTLSSLARKLSEDGDLYFTFISDMYDELAIAFRKPEMDLFEPAARLLTHAVLPNIVGFNYFLSKIVPISLNALDDNELRPISGLAYIFEQLHCNHPKSRLKPDVEEQIAGLVLKMIEHLRSDRDGLRLLNALIRHQVKLDDIVLDQVAVKLWHNISKSSLDLEECLALICTNYKKLDMICGAASNDYQLGSLMKLINNFNQDIVVARDAHEGVTPSHLLKFSVYLRLLILELDQSSRAEIDNIDKSILADHLVIARDLALKVSPDRKLISKIAQVHAIVLNKLSADHVNSLLLKFFGSSYCQKLTPSTNDERNIVLKVYLPILGWIFKSLVIRNHHLATPIINLLLNFINSDKVDQDLALTGSKLFGFILADDTSDMFNKDKQYQTFMLYKQKFYLQTSKEIKIRFETQTDDSKRNLLLSTIALQVSHLPLAVYKKDRDWLIRQLLRVLSSFKLSETTATHKHDGNTVNSENPDEELLYVMYGCVESLLQKDQCDDFSGFLTSLVDINIKHAQEAKTLRVRRRALACLANVAVSFRDSDLLTLRPKVIDRLRPCLADKKRLVRQMAAEARSKWVLVGQPIGPTTGI